MFESSQKFHVGCNIFIFTGSVGLRELSSLKMAKSDSESIFLQVYMRLPTPPKKLGARLITRAIEGSLRCRGERNCSSLWVKKLTLGCFCLFCFFSPLSWLWGIDEELMRPKPVWSRNWGPRYLDWILRKRSKVDTERPFLEASLS